MYENILIPLFLNGDSAASTHLVNTLGANDSPNGMACNSSTVRQHLSLTEWHLSNLIKEFKDQEIDEEVFYDLDDKEIDKLITKLGPKKKFKLFKKEKNTTYRATADSSAKKEKNTTYRATADSSAKKEKNTTYRATADSSAKKEKNTTYRATVDSSAKEHEEAVSAQVCPSTSGTSNKEKRKLDLQGESSKSQSPAKKRHCGTKPRSDSEEILTKVKNIMSFVKKRLKPAQENKLNNFLKDKIDDLERDKREVVGVFGRTGAGKSSLINAVIGVKNLLPTGDVSACTSVMIKVEANTDANTQNKTYQADIEFITKEEWKDELFQFLGDKADQEDDYYPDFKEKLSALYGEEKENKTSEMLMDKKYFKEIPKFLKNEKQILTCESAEKLSTRLVRFTKKKKIDQESSNEVRNSKWHVTLVDLPGNGDCNQSRDKMWKELVRSCSTLWIVTDIERAAAETEAWEILESASSLMGNGGECQHIHFICSRSDVNLNNREAIFNRNMKAKKAVRKKFSQQDMIKKQFSDECLKVFTVSSTEILAKIHLNPDETEIPKLKEFLQKLNDCHSESVNHVSGALGILSLIQGASRRKGAGKNTDVCTDLDKKMKHELDEVRKPMKEAYKAFEKCLSEGVERSKSSCESVLMSVIHPVFLFQRKVGFHQTLKCVVNKGGTHKSKKGKQINLNGKLASCLTDSIDEEFKKTFPNERKCGPFNNVINTFSLDTKSLIKKYKDVKLQLIFLKTEEDKIKTELNKMIRERKKTIYNSLTEPIGENMQEGYSQAATFKGKDSLENMRDTLKKHVRAAKNIMFERAKEELLKQLRDLMKEILEKLKKTMQNSIELSLKTDGDSIPDVTRQLEEVKDYYIELKPQRQSP
ncbi:nuclear GTPase SLIP-GC-like [Perca fluviatilis]|uniref:nuclear GTPase SLIP-GC-like n=1 Tax=Perca fluviatilis TaxID=8168 RepID=UPI001962B442|nr:nuclear GTPase SLIP-GC-like [Perca fluviatilis]